MKDDRCDENGKHIIEDITHRVSTFISWIDEDGKHMAIEDITYTFDDA